MSVDNVQKYDLMSAALLNRPDVQVLSALEEREILVQLDACRNELLEAQVRSCGDLREDARDEWQIQDLVRSLMEPNAARDEREQRLSQVAARYNELRNRLAMANLRLVAHVAKRYRNRGISSSDLLQEGFCGLLRAIDRFQPSRETRLASYAVWWIRQSIQRAVAAGAYPVRLNPRHLQQLAESNSQLGAGPRPGRKPRSAGSAATIGQIHSATRPTLSLNASIRPDEGPCLIQRPDLPRDRGVSRTPRSTSTWSS